jgi:hypothetical protein
MKLIALAMVAPLSGCAAMGGGADYTYQHIDKNGASCSVTVGSTRSLRGAGITITKDCELKAKAEALEANEALARAVLELTKKVQAVPLPVVTP